LEVPARPHRFTKLRAMSAREVFARAAYNAYTTYERTCHRRGWLTASDRLRGGLVPDFGRQHDWQHALVSSLPRTRFFAGVDAGDQTRQLFVARFGDEHRKAREVASEVARGEIAFFGRRFSLGAEIRWHADPVTGTSWPRVYHRDVPVHGGNIGFGDVKYVWEINRHQFFVDLAKVAFLDDAGIYAREIHRLLGLWTTNVPYATGVPWACALEPAFRAWSWLWTYHLLRAAGMVDLEDHILWLTGLYDHGRFLYRHLEPYSSPYNHLIGEASALFALGVLFPCFREARAWSERGKQVLDSTLVAQFHSDGGSVEQSTFYHHATLGFYILAAVLGRRNGADLSPDAWAAIERGIQFSASLVQPNRLLPRIGGADDGKAIRMGHLGLWDFRPFQAIGAVLFGRPDFKFVAGRFWEDALWVLGPDGADEFARLHSREPRSSVALPASGYYIVRSGWSVDADYLCFDCGPQAAGLRRDDVPSAAHGHADCLSVIAALGGREVLVDPGFFCYNGDPPWEGHFRRTGAHNTITVDGRDQARHVSKMAWARTYVARPEGWSAEGLGWARGSHDGYARGSRGVTHRRTAWLRPDGYVVIYDELTGAGEHDLEAVFQFAPGRAEMNSSWMVYEDQYELVWICSAPVRARVSYAGDGPASGWIAPSLGIREPAPRLTLEFSITDRRVGLLTILADRRRHGASAARRVIAVEGVQDGLLRARVAGSGYADEVIAAVEGAAATSEVDTDAPLVIMRRTNSVVREALQAGGTRVEVRVAAGASWIAAAAAGGR
jgi:hypothetical protein